MKSIVAFFLHKYTLISYVILSILALLVYLNVNDISSAFLSDASGMWNILFRIIFIMGFIGITLNLWMLFTIILIVVLIIKFILYRKTK